MSVTEQEPAGGREAAAPAAPGTGSRFRALGGGLAGNYRQVVSRGAAIVAFVVMVVVFVVARPDTFATVGTLTDVLDQASVPVMLACGLTFILASGQFDLSFTGTLGVVSATVAVLLSKAGLSTWPAVGLSLLVAVVAGVAVGFVVSLRPNATFIVTLSLGSALTGAELAVSDNKTIYDKIPAEFSELTSTKWLGLYRPVWLALAVVIVTAVLLHGTRFGRQVSATGSNSTAAFLAGVRVRRVWALCFLIVSVAAGLAAISFTSTQSSYIPGSFTIYLLTTYTAVFLGSTVAGGKFTIAGSVFGVLWLTILQTGLTQLNQPSWTSNVVQGVLLTLAVLLSSGGWRART